MEQTFTTLDRIDFQGMASEVNASDSQSIFVVAGFLDSVMICQQLKKVGFTAPVFISD